MTKIDVGLGTSAPRDGDSSDDHRVAPRRYDGCLLAPRMIEPVRALWNSLAGRVGTEAPPVLVRVALRSSAGRRRLNEKEEEEKCHILRAAAPQGRHKNGGFARRASFFRRGLAAPCERGEACSRVFVPGLAGGLQRRTQRAAALFAGAGAGEEEENEKCTTLPPHQHAPRPDHPVPPPPPSRSKHCLS